MKKHFKIEGIPRIPSRIYSALVTKSPFIKDFYQEAAVEICSRVLFGRILVSGHWFFRDERGKERGHPQTYIIKIDRTFHLCQHIPPLLNPIGKRN